MAVNHRKSRVADGVRDEVAMIIAREIRDPRLGFVTLIRVEMPVDQSIAKIYVSPMGDLKTQAESMRALHHSRGFVRKLLSQRMRTRTVPEIMFIQDKGLDAAARVGEIMAGWKADEKRLNPDPESVDASESEVSAGPESDETGAGRPGG